jgi:uncharacterized protein YcbX
MLTRDGHEVVRVDALWRYPVKSLQGESCAELDVGPLGVAGDRRYGVFDVGSKTVISAKRDGRLLEASASLSSDQLSVTLPGGHVLPPGAQLDEELSTWLGRPVRLAQASQLGPATFECPDDFEDDDSPTVQWQGIEGSFVDESELHLLSTGDLGRLCIERPDLAWDVRRFRPNIVLDARWGDTSFRASPGTYRLGEVEIEVYKTCSRCVMTTRAQPGGLTRELDILRHVSRVHGGDVGVRARVTRAGVVRVGDEFVAQN